MNDFEVVESDVMKRLRGLEGLVEQQGKVIDLLAESQRHAEERLDRIENYLGDEMSINP